MMTKKCQAVVISCMDYRFHEALYEYLKQEGLCGEYDLVSLPGGCLDYGSKQLMDIVEMAVTLHDIQGSVYLCHHEDCGAYGLKGDLQEQLSHQSGDMQAFARLIKAKFPELEVRLCFFTLKDSEPLEIEVQEE